MSQPSLRELLDVATEAAHAAGTRALGYFKVGEHALGIERKGDDTPVTVADRSAETVCRDVLSRYFPTHKITGEEHPDQGSDDRYTWIIDPIDGTKSFIYGVPLWGTLLGCLVDGKPSVGVIYCAGLDEMVAAADGEGCWFNGRRAKCSDVARIEDAAISTTSITRAIDRSGAYRDMADRAKLNRGWGDAYAYLSVAMGRTDAALDPKVSVWDVSPYPPIFREAGGHWGNWNGESDIKGNDSFACAAGLKDEILATIKKHES